MGLFRRVFERVREWVAPSPPPPPWSDTPPPPTSPPTPPSPPGPSPFPYPPQDLPPGWKFEGLYYSTLPEDQRRVINQHPTDNEVATADSIIVSYTDGLGIQYRTIHGANSRKQVGDLIGRVIQVVSPT